VLRLLRAELPLINVLQQLASYCAMREIYDIHYALYVTHGKLLQAYYSWCHLAVPGHRWYIPPAN